MEFDHRPALRKAIQYFKSQKNLANAINVDKRKINDWLNRDGRIIPYHFAIAIELATHGKISREALAPHIRYKKDKNILPHIKIHREKLMDESNETELKISERANKGMELEKKIGKRQGKRTHSQLLGTNQLIAGKKTREFVALSVGFKSDRHYRRAKKIVLTGCKELIAAIDQKYIALNVGEVLANLSHKDQRHFLSLPKKEMISKARKLIQRTERSENYCVEKSTKNDAEIEIF